MFAVVEMFGGVFVLGGIAASDLAAYHAHAEMNPRVSNLYALFTDVFVCGFDLDLIQMFAFG
jgi:hypothetical protein